MQSGPVWLVPTQPNLLNRNTTLPHCLTYRSANSCSTTEEAAAGSYTHNRHTGEGTFGMMVHKDVQMPNNITLRLMYSYPIHIFGWWGKITHLSGHNWFENRINITSICLGMQKFALRICAKHWDTSYDNLLIIIFKRIKSQSSSCPAELSCQAVESRKSSSGVFHQIMLRYFSTLICVLIVSLELQTVILPLLVPKTSM